MKSKLDLAHDWAMKALDEWYVTNTVDLVDAAWIYADAMYEQHEKRSPPAKSIADIAREINRPDMDKKHVYAEEWQPDWSMAPEGCDWWAMDKDGLSCFYNYKPYISDMSDYWGDSDLLNNDGIAHECDITNYTSHWRDSLRKRPK